MPQYELFSPDGKRVVIEAERPPANELEIKQIFSDPSIANRPLTREEFEAHDIRKSERDFWGEGGKFQAGKDAAGVAISGIADTFGQALLETPSFLAGLKSGKAKSYKTVAEAATRGSTDFMMLLSDIGSSIKDEYWGYSQADEYDREYDRYVEKFYMDKSRKEGLLFGDDEVFSGLTEAGGMFIDPTIVAGGFGKIPTMLKSGARLGVKKTATGASKALSGTSKLLEKGTGIVAKPREWTEAAINKAFSGVDPETIKRGVVTGYVGGAAMGVPIAGDLAKLEGLGKLSAFGLESMADVAKVLSQPSGQKRFLHRLSQDHTVFKKMPFLRTVAGLADEFGGTRLGDFAFDYLIDTASIATLQAGLAAAAGGGAEEVGAAIGSSLPLGVASAALGSSQGGATTQLLDAQGRPTARSLEQITIFTKKAYNKNQLNNFKTLPDNVKALVAVMDASGLGTKTRFVSDKFMDRYNKIRGIPEGRQAAMFDPETNVILVNEKYAKGLGARELNKIIIEEYMHKLARKAIARDPQFEYDMAKIYETTPEKGVKFSLNGEEIYLKPEVKKFMDDYNTAIGFEQLSVDDASAVLDEIGARQFATVLIEDPNIINQTRIGGISDKANTVVSKLLQSIGLTDNVGKLLNDPVANSLKKNKDVINLYRNSIKLQDRILSNRAKRSEDGNKIVSAKGLEGAKDKFQKMGGTVYKETKTPKKSTNIAKQMHKDVPDASDITSLGGSGKSVSPEYLKFLDSSPAWGKELANKIREVTDAITNQFEIAFAYSPRTYKSGNVPLNVYSATPFSLFMSKAGNISAEAWVTSRIENNMYKLARAGFAGDIKDLQNRVRTKMEEIRNRPADLVEIEKNRIGDDLLAAVFGANPEFIKDGKIKKFSQEGNLENPIRRFRVDTLQGLNKIGEGMTLNYENVKIAYSPKRSKPVKERFSPRQMDTQYMNAVDAGDTATAQKLVDDAAKRAGYNVKAYHGTNVEFNEFDPMKSAGQVMWFSEDANKIKAGESGAAGFSNIKEVYLKTKKTAGWDEYERLSIGQIEDLGFDSVKLDDDYIIFSPEQIKSSDPITRDAEGNVIPLSERFQETSRDIRFAPRSERAIADIENYNSIATKYGLDENSNIVNIRAAISKVINETNSPESISDFESINDINKKIAQALSDEQYEKWVRGADPFDENIVSGDENPSYKGQHEAPDHESGSPLSNLTLNGHYPDDVYSAKGRDYYAGYTETDYIGYSEAIRSKGRPNSKIKIYRVIPKEAKGGINAGDWVTLSRKYAKDHGEGSLGGNYKITTKTVFANELFTNGDSLDEFGYMPRKLQKETSRGQ